MAVDIRRVENQKENIAPADGGRSASELELSLDMLPLAGSDRMQLQHEISERQHRLEEALRRCPEKDDPLQLFVDHIKFLRSGLPQNTSKPLKAALEGCAHRFCESLRYKDDSRYLAVWLEYLKLAREPVEVFKYMAQKRIGQGLSRFYEEYANCLESRGQFSHAEQVYKHALDRGTKPEDTLTRAYAEFKDRTRLPASNPVHSGRAPHANPLPGGRLPLAGRERIEQPRTGGAGNQPSHRSFEVYVDTEPVDRAVPSANESAAFPQARSQNGENMPVPRPTGPLGVAVPKKRQIQVYRDPEPLEDLPPPKKVPAGREQLMVNLEYLYQQDGLTKQEYCLEELILQSRRLTHSTFARREAKPRPPKQEFEKFAEPEPTRVMGLANNYMDNVFGGYDDGMTGMLPSYHDEDRTAALHRQHANYFRGQAANEQVGSQVYRQAQVPAFGQQYQGFHAPQRPPEPKPQPKPMQNALFEDLASAKLVLAPGPVPSLPPVVDASQPAVRQMLLPRILESLKALPFFEQHTQSSQMLGTLKREKLPVVLPLPKFNLTLKSKIGEGGYGTVWLASNEATRKTYALKGESSSIPWEAYVVNIARSRVDDKRVLDSLVSTYYYEGFRDEQYQLMPLFLYDTLLSLARELRARSAPDKLVEALAMYFAIEILRVVEQLHKHHIIHGDIKAENVMLRAPENTQQFPLFGEYKSDGSGSWSHYGVTLIDFGRSIDLELFPKGQQFKAGWTNHAQDCYEIQHGQPWSYQTDYHGIASVVHAILFGKYLEVKVSGGRKGITEAFKRYWQSDIWSEVFDTLLNPPATGLPITQQLSACRSKLESWLQANSKDMPSLLTSLLVQLKRKKR